MHVFTFIFWTNVYDLPNCLNNFSFSLSLELKEVNSMTYCTCNVNVGAADVKHIHVHLQCTYNTAINDNPGSHM